MTNTFKEQAKIFKAFCDENRLRILSLLTDGEKCACIILEQFEIAQSTLSYHMKILCDAGIVASRQDGKWTHYKISKKGIAVAIAVLEKIMTDTNKNSLINANKDLKRCRS